jgi:hypothetical protein
VDPRLAVSAALETGCMPIPAAANTGIICPPVTPLRLAPVPGRRVRISRWMRSFPERATTSRAHSAGVTRWTTLAVHASGLPSRLWFRSERDCACS